MHPVSENMWEEYSRTRSPELKRQLVFSYVGLVRFVVGKFKAGASRNGQLLDHNDLLQLGLMGLLDAIERYEHTRGVKFETYAVPRIRGTVQDELRKLDWVPRSIREKARTVDRAMQRMQCEAPSATAAKMAEELDLTVDEFQQMLRDTSALTEQITASGDEIAEMVENLPAESSSDPFETLNRDQVTSMMIEIIEQLPEQDRLVISLYYYEELTFREIAQVLRLSESRVFQKHAAVLAKMRQLVKELA